MWKNRFCVIVIDVEIVVIVKDWFRFVVDREGGWKKSEDRKREWEVVINI